jgi:DNA-binding XRE family transcriptional regulator
MTDTNDMAYTVGRAAALIESYAKKHFGPGTLTKLISQPRYHIGVFAKYVPADAWDEFAEVDFPASLVPVQQGIAWIGYDHAKKELAEQDSEPSLRLFVGSQLHAFRIKRGLTTRQLAELTGLTHSHIVRIEAGKYNVGIDTLEKLILALGAELNIK